MNPKTNSGTATSNAKTRQGAQSLEKARLQLTNNNFVKQQLNLIHPSATVLQNSGEQANGNQAKSLTLNSAKNQVSKQMWDAIMN